MYICIDKLYDPYCKYTMVCSSIGTYWYRLDSQTLSGSIITDILDKRRHSGIQFGEKL